MDSAEDNPESNKLTVGLSENELSDVISKSGYPLQIVVGRILSNNGLDAQQEWTYTDKQENKERNIDIFATKVLDDFENEPKVVPLLDLLIHCKRSDLPYLFFLIDKIEDWYDIVWCVGTRKDSIDINPNSSNPARSSILNALGLDRLPFTSGDLRRCMSFTKCVRNPKLHVMGDEPFNDIVLPLVKAANHFKEVRAKPPKNARVYDCHLLMCVAVIDAPMIAISVNDGVNQLTAVPWVRVSRSIVSESDIYFGEEHEIFIDVVHKDYLLTYLQNHLLPFAKEFKDRVLRHQKELFSCKAQVSNLEDILYKNKDIEKDLHPIRRQK